MRTEEKLYTVYRLKNVVTGKNYIGMTGDAPKKRWGYGYVGKMGDAIKQFPFDLCWKKHIEFQTPNKEQALELEAELMKWYDSVDNGYNTSTFSSGAYKHSEEHKNKVSESLTGRTLSEEHRKKLSESMTGKHHTEESKKKMSEAKTGEKHPMFGKHHSEETKNKISEAHIGKHPSEEHRKKMSESHGVYGILQFTKDGEFIAEYPSLHEASRQTGCSQGNLCECCKGKRKQCGGYAWKYKEEG